MQVVYFRDASQTLATVLEYFSNEILLQSTGSLDDDDETAREGKDVGGHWVQGLINTSFAEMVGAAERRFLRHCALALSAGNSILIICDGLEEEQWVSLAELVVHVHQEVASQLQSLRFNGHEAPSIQCILSVTNHPGPFGRPAGDGRLAAPGAGRRAGGGKNSVHGPKEGKKGVRGEAREVELLDLTDEEKLAIAMQVFEEVDLPLPERAAAAAKDGAQPDELKQQQQLSSREGLAATLAQHADSHLPLYLVAAATLVAQFEKSHLRHRQIDSVGIVQRAGAVDEYARELPGSLTALWTDFVLRKLEDAVDVLTVQWVVIHLLNHPGGLSRGDLQAMVRATLDRVQQREEPLGQGMKRGTQRAVQRVMVVGPREVPSFIVDVDTGDVLWDHRRRPVKEALAIIAKLSPYTGRIWCTDQELHLILSQLRPFLRPTGCQWWGEDASEAGGVGSGRAAGMLASEWEGLLVLDHEKLRVEALYRYDNPGSISLKEVAAPSGGKRGKSSSGGAGAARKQGNEQDAGLEQQQQLLVAHLDAHAVLGYPGSSPSSLLARACLRCGSVADLNPFHLLSREIAGVRDVRLAGYAGGPQLQMRFITSSCGASRKSKVAVKVAPNASMKPLEIAGLSEDNMSGALIYKHSALASDDVTSFFHSLDDNCVWHLYHFDQVVQLFPGAKMSRAKFRGRRPGKGKGSKVATLFGRFPKDEHLLMLLDGTLQGAGERAQANDTCAKNRMDLTKAREVIRDSERCIELPFDPEIDGGRHVAGEYTCESGPEQLPAYLCNYSAVTSDLQYSLDMQKGCIGYAVSIDIDIDEEADDDQFIITGGAGKPMTSTRVEDDGRVVKSVIAGIEAAFPDRSVRAHTMREWRWNGRVVWSRSRFGGKFGDIEELFDLGPRKEAVARLQDVLRTGTKTVSCGRAGCKQKVLRTGASSQVAATHDDYCSDECARKDAGPRSIWRKGRPWFAIRYGQPYILSMSGVDLEASSREVGARARLLLQQTMGTIHERPLAVDGMVEVHFFDAYDYLNAIDGLRKLGIRFSERKAGIKRPVGGVGGLAATEDGFAEASGQDDGEGFDLAR